MKFSVGEYLAINQKLEDQYHHQAKLEYYAGLVIPRLDSEPVLSLDFDFLLNFFNTNKEIMATHKHSSISLNTIREFTNFVEKNEKYELFDNTFQVFLEKIKTYVLPDLTVAESANKVIINEQLQNPLIAIEILSKSTEKKDKTIKKEAYLACDSMRDYLMIDQYELNIIHHFRTENSWQTEIYTSINDVIAFAGIPLVLPVNKIYKNVL